MSKIHKDMQVFQGFMCPDILGSKCQFKVGQTLKLRIVSLTDTVHTIFAQGQY